MTEFIEGILRCKGPARAIDQAGCFGGLRHLMKMMNVI